MLNTNKNISTGVYQHFKGGFVLVLFCAKHSDRDEIEVVYKGLNDGKFYARPLESFCQQIDYQGVMVSRFTKVDDELQSIIKKDKIKQLNILLND